jgi:hypothetical protein
MFTLFAIPKPFLGHIAIIQRNAIQSWIRLHPDCEVILLGDEDGTQEAATEFRIKHIRELKRNEYGTPLISSAFASAQEIASHQLMCYVNADIILVSDFPRAIQQLNKPNNQFLMVGQRWNININETLDFGRPDWETVLRALVAKSGELFTPLGIDYFAFRHGQYLDMPPFAVGRPMWDNWMIYKARLLHIPVIDATKVVTAIHQNHGYQHVSNSTDGTFRGPEGDKNLELAGGWSRMFSIQDADRIITPEGLMKPKMSYSLFTRHIETVSALRPRLRFIAKPLYYFVYLFGIIFKKLKQLIYLIIRILQFRN